MANFTILSRFKQCRHPNGVVPNLRCFWCATAFYGRF